MIKEHIKLALEANHIKYEAEKDYFSFHCSAKIGEFEYVIAWDESKQIVQFVVNTPFQQPKSFTSAEIAHMLNSRNCNADWLSVEADESGTLYCRLTSFLPDGRDAAVAICSKALLFFLRESYFLITQVQNSINGMTEYEQQMVSVCEVKRILNSSFHGYVHRHTQTKEMIAHA